jgi:hypothetical protein
MGCRDWLRRVSNRRGVRGRRRIVVVRRGGGIVVGFDGPIDARGTSGTSIIIIIVVVSGYGVN